jgi:hypothetical protein
MTARIVYTPPDPALSHQCALPITTLTKRITEGTIAHCDECNKYWRYTAVDQMRTWCEISKRRGRKYDKDVR